ncbi:MAG: hypothetical protein JW759_10610 [Candidatus Coatesbacteria bacterium]|nr:hypothetical protein [Candidatus Coatesbacteria bacterium]
MSNKLNDEQINKIAETLAAKLAEPGGDKLLGCGSVSSTERYDCSGTYNCSSYYECGGDAWFRCSSFTCESNFKCTNDRYGCYGTFRCSSTYNWQ